MQRNSGPPKVSKDHSQLCNNTNIGRWLPPNETKEVKEIRGETRSFTKNGLGKVFDSVYGAIPSWYMGYLSQS